MSGAVWDERLITRERALELAGRLRFSFHEHPGDGAIHLHCREDPYSGGGEACYQSITRVLPGQQTTAEDVLSAVLRHAVMAHDLDLGRRDGRGQGASARRGGVDRGGSGAHPAGDRPRDQTGDPAGGETAPGDDAA